MTNLRPAAEHVIEVLENTPFRCPTCAVVWTAEPRARTAVGSGGRRQRIGPERWCFCCCFAWRWVRRGAGSGGPLVRAEV